MGDGSLVFSKIRQYMNGEDITTIDFMNALAHKKENEIVGRIGSSFNFTDFS